MLVYVDQEINTVPDPESVIRLRDSVYPLRVSLHYRIHEAYDLIERWVTLENLGNDPVLVERVYPAKWTLPYGDDFHLTHLYGQHVDEFHLKREPLTQGLKTLESRRLIPSHHATPWFAVDRDATEDTGKVWFGTLAWNAASRLLHDYVRDTLLPHGKALHKVLYNSWETTLFNMDEAWVTDADHEHVPLEFRFHVSMCGSLGLGGNLLVWSAAERELAADCIKLYKKIRPIIQHGDQYRMRSPQQGAKTGRKG